MYRKMLWVVVCTQVFTFFITSANGAHLFALEASHRVKVVMIGRESSLHTTLMDQATYRVKVMPSQSPSYEAIAIDSFPSYAQGMPTELQGGGATFFVRLRRTPFCDRQTDGLAPTRCFAIEHGSWKAAGHMPAETWWK